jgi:hypothetical protein
VVEEMRKRAQVKKADAVYDLGGGDGRILVPAARKYGCRAVGDERDRRCAEPDAALRRLAAASRSRPRASSRGAIRSSQGGKQDARG